MRRLALLSVTVVAVLIGSAPVAFAAGTIRIPAGYEVTSRRSLGSGVTHIELARARPPLHVNVAWIDASSDVELRSVLSNDAIYGAEPRLEDTSDMCVRIHCIVAVNGDFFADTGEPVGAVVSEGILARSPNAKHHQLIIEPDGTLATGVMEWRGSLVPEDLRAVALDGVNIERRADKVVLYTPEAGPSTGTNPYGVELILRTLHPAGPIRLGQTVTVQLAELRHGGDTTIPADGAVISGHGRGATALEALWQRVALGQTSNEALLRLDTTPSAAESIGGSPILVRDGRRWFAEEDRSLYSDRHPRTMVGWTRAGDVMLVTVDGRQPSYSVGMTMREAADLMIELGATEALNLDGGGSTTFVVGGTIANRVSDRSVRRDGRVETVQIPRAGDEVLGRVERPVAVALAIVAPRTIAVAMPLVTNLPRWGGSNGSPAGAGSSKGHAAIPLTVLTAVGAVGVRRRVRAGLQPARSAA